MYTDSIKVSAKIARDITVNTATYINAWGGVCIMITWIHGNVYHESMDGM